jgi:hypothetical protein
MIELKAMYKIFYLFFIKSYYHMRVATRPCFCSLILFSTIFIAWDSKSLFTTCKFSGSHHTIYLSFIVPFFANTKSKILPILIVEVICLLFRIKFNAKFWSKINRQILTIILVLLSI